MLYDNARIKRLDDLCDKVELDAATFKTLPLVDALAVAVTLARADLLRVCDYRCAQDARTILGEEWWEICEITKEDREDEAARQVILAEELFVVVEVPKRLRKVYARAVVDPGLARRLLFERFDFAGQGISKNSPHADVLKQSSVRTRTSTRMK